MTALLICDTGTTGVRAAIVDGDASIRHVTYRPFPPSSPFDGLVEFDAAELARVVLESANTAMEAAGEPITAVGITNQRASTVVWERSTGEPIAPALGWQDLRTINECILARSEHGYVLNPNQSATKVAWLLENTPGTSRQDLCFGTVDSWLLWTLTQGRVHATDRTNAAMTGLVKLDGATWDDPVCAALGIPLGMLPRIVNTSGAVVGEATALEGAPPITALVGDQQASLVGQGCVHPGLAKITFGTGGMLDVCTGAEPPSHSRRGEHGTYPTVGWSRDGTNTWAREGIMLAAGANVEWLRDDLGLIESVEESCELASRCDTTDGAVYVPAVLGLGTPVWDFGARGTLLGIGRGIGAPQVTRAVLEGIAHRGADLVESAELDAGLTIPTVRVDGGMSVNHVFVQAIANTTQRPVEVSPVTEATTLGAAFLAGVGVGAWSDIDDAVQAWDPAATVEPATVLDRDQWHAAVERAERWYPELSALDFA